MIIARDREIIARNLINIIDVKNCQYFSLFMNDDLTAVIKKFFWGIKE